MLQNIFYTLAIIYLSLGIILLVGIGIATIYVIRMARSLKEKVEQKIESIESLVSHPAAMAKGAGRLIVDALAFGVQKMWRKT